MLGQPDTVTLHFHCEEYKMSERMLSAIQAVEKGGHLVFPLMRFSAFPEYMDLLRKAMEKKIQNHADK